LQYILASTSGGLAKSRAADVSEPDGAVELGFVNRQTVYRLKQQVNHPPDRVEWLCETGQEWSGTRLLFHVESRGKGSLLRFTHGGWLPLKESRPARCFCAIASHTKATDSKVQGRNRSVLRMSFAVE
jgi:hypothetical protein